ncbi:MAG: D-alanyl-D-alanine carboxypeptidase [Lachnospiraceae bacterium]|nr:D-alanyl-D-alanine carboxypeptidase [Lachnospiraceae bacterium]
MADMENRLDEEAARRAQWKKRKEEMRRQKQRQELFRKAAIPGIAVVFVLFVICVVIARGKKTENTDIAQEQIVNEEEESVLPVQAEAQINQAADEDGSPLEQQESEQEEEAEDNVLLTEYRVTEDTIQLGSEIVSSYAVFIDMESGEIMARKGERTRIVPASMTKVLTLLVAVENIDDLDDTFEITSDITDYCLKNDCSNAGFEAGEVVTIRDLLYAAILPSGADGALGLAYYVAGSQEAFVGLMNEKLEELGLAGTAHFTNCIGLYDDNHYCTVYDMAVIMQAAIENEICMEVLSAHTYTTSETEKHPEGILISNWFLRRIEDKDTNGEVICGKTGYVDQSKHCAVSYGIDKDGRKYICVTADAAGTWRCIEDHAYLYKEYSAAH